MSDKNFTNLNWKGKKILIVEDDISSTYFLKEVLEDTGVDLAYASDGLTAINMCEEDLSISLVLMDIQIPYMNGYETSAVIKELRPDLSIIAQTAHAFTEDRLKCLESGCDDYISKPMDPFELLEKLNKYMQTGN